MTNVAEVVCSDIATPIIRRLELPLNEEVRAVQPRRGIGGGISGIFGLEQDLAIISGLGSGETVQNLGGLPAGTPGD